MMPGDKAHVKDVRKAGENIHQADKALIMLHGRGGTPEDILSLAPYFAVEKFALMAPQAAGNTWYPYSFMAPPDKNEPWLSSALEMIEAVVQEIVQEGITKENIFFLGFSQGACLALEFIARNALLYGGVVAFSGGLIGDRIYTENYKGNFKGTPIFIGSSDPDPHVPVNRVYATANILQEMHAEVKEKIYHQMGHTIISDEIKLANEWVFSSKKE